MDLTRKQFLSRIAGTGVLIASGSFTAASATVLSRTGQRQIKYGVALADFTGSYGSAQMVEASLAAAAATGTHGVEIDAEKHVLGYPYPSAEWVRGWQRWMASYEVHPSCYNAPAYTANHTPELLRYIARDLKIAKMLGFGVVRIDLSRVPVNQWVDLAERAAPLANQKNVRIAVRPDSSDGESKEACVELLRRDSSGCLGLAVQRSRWKDVVGPAGSSARVHHMYEILESPSFYSRERQRWEFRTQSRAAADTLALDEIVSAGYAGFITRIYEGPRPGYLTADRLIGA